MLSNLEAAAEGAPSPPRFLLLFWPSGVVKSSFVPATSGFDYEVTPSLKPIIDAGLRNDTIVVFGPGDRFQSQGGGEESGVVMRTTGVAVPGTRANGGEADDGIAAGPSMEQILLKHVPALSAPGGRGTVSAIGDGRAASQEISVRCLSYDYATRTIEAALGGSLVENIPRLPELKPAALYASVFAAYIPGSGGSAEALKALQLRKSVLDYSLGELGRLRTLAPGSQREKIDLHEDAIRKLEQQLSDAIDMGPQGACQLPAAPDPTLAASWESKYLITEVVTDVDEGAVLEKVCDAHLSVIRAAFQCDLLRVATFQYASATDWTAFKGLMPGDDEKCYRHFSMLHREPREVPGSATTEFMANVNAWYNAQAAKLIQSLKATTDTFGNSLLDTTIAPFVTEMSGIEHGRSPLAALIFGGKALGMQGGQFQNLEKERRSFNDFWLSVAQAYLAADPKQLLAEELFVKGDAYLQGPIPGLWKAPV